MKLDGRGFFPPHGCRSCGKTLNADGGHPAELYAGTYTGLCYGCQNSEPVKVKDVAPDLQVWSFPPCCPSWRRDRETYVGKTGCPNCDGRGRIKVDRPDSKGGDYAVNCECARDYVQDV